MTYLIGKEILQHIKRHGANLAAGLSQGRQCRPNKAGKINLIIGAFQFVWTQYHFF